MANLTRPLAIGSTVLGVGDVAHAQEFWTAALGYVLRDEPDDTWAVLIPRDRSGAQLALMLSETPVQDHPRVHLDLYAVDQAGRSRAIGRVGRVQGRILGWVYAGLRLHRTRGHRGQSLLRDRQKRVDRQVGAELMERVTRIELALSAWEAERLPLLGALSWQL